MARFSRRSGVRVVFGAAGKIILGAGIAKGTEIVVTEGNVGSAIYGFANDGLFGPYGSVLPTQYLGININGIFMTDEAQDQFIVWLEGNLAQDVFESVEIENGTVFETASATSFNYSSEYDFSVWTWNTTKPSSWDGSGTQTLIFTP